MLVWLLVPERACHDAGLVRFAAAPAGPHAKVERAWVPVTVHEVSLPLGMPTERSASVDELPYRSHARKPMPFYVAKPTSLMPDVITPPVRRSRDTSSGALNLLSVSEESDDGGIRSPGWGWLADSVFAAERRERRPSQEYTAIAPFALFGLDTRGRHDNLTATFLAPYSSRSGPFGEEEPEEQIWWNRRREEEAPKR